MSTAENLDAGQEPEVKEVKKSAGEYAASIGSTLKSATGKVCAIGGGIGLSTILTLVQVVLAMLFIDTLGLGLVMGSLIGIVSFFIIGYLGNGLQGGTWNPFNYFTGLFA